MNLENILRKNKYFKNIIIKKMDNKYDRVKLTSSYMVKIHTRRPNFYQNQKLYCTIVRNFLLSSLKNLVVKLIGIVF